MISLRACGNGPRLPMLSPPNPDLKNSKTFLRVLWGGSPAPWNSTPYPSAAASPCSMSDCLASSGRSGQTAIASRSSHHELRSIASLFASPSYKSAVSPAFLALGRVVRRLQQDGRLLRVHRRVVKVQLGHSCYFSASEMVRATSLPSTREPSGV